VARLLFDGAVIQEYLITENKKAIQIGWLLSLVIYISLPAETGSG
jgi:activator of HSP90 ATPase